MKSEKLSNIINFSPGRVVYEEFILDDRKTWIEQIDQLNEDLLQVGFLGNIVLDLGWYPAFNHKGQFQMRVIRDCNWDAPIFYAEVTKMDVLRSVVDAARQTATEAAFVTA